MVFRPVLSIQKKKKEGNKEKKPPKIIFKPKH
jgi:hypothetical protein